jgi:MoaA/NifB/PqqE/SkfB family radical SAM enzyme
MELDFFESIIKQARLFTNEIACHVFGDPLILSNLKEYLDIIDRYGMKALLTTSGYFIKKHSYETLFHPAVKQINISLNAFNKNDTRVTFEQYMRPILELCHEKVFRKKESFINLRIWNLDEVMSEREFNSKLFEILSSSFDVDLTLPKERSSIRLEYKVLLHFDNYFEWPSMDNPNYGHGTCQGLDSHIAILASGIVVPCCLDSKGVIELGSLHNHSLREIVQGRRAKEMREGFRVGKCSEELCLKCSYKDRFG